jgi:hypothetical protein
VLYFPGRRFGHLCSNIVESTNQMLKEERELPILRFLDEIWYHIMNDRAKKLTAAKKTEADGIR